jgi:hypothetical protein
VNARYSTVAALGVVFYYPLNAWECINRTAAKTASPISATPNVIRSKGENNMISAPHAFSARYVRRSVELVPAISSTPGIVKKPASSQCVPSFGEDKFNFLDWTSGRCRDSQLLAPGRARSSRELRFPYGRGA